MADKIKSPILILIVLILLSLFLTGGVFYLLQKEKATSSALRLELANLKMTQRMTESQLAESKKEVSQLGLKLREAQTQVDALTFDLGQEKTAKQEALGQIAQLKIDLEQQKKLRSDLENKLLQAQGDMKKIQTELNAQDTKKVELEKKIKDLQAQLQQAQTRDVELGTIVVAPESPVSSLATAEAAVMPTQEKTTVLASPGQGKVLVVNKEYNFAVINLGSKDGVNIGDIFSVYHNNQYVGDVKIEKIHDAMSAAGYTSVDMKNKISEGDKVVAKTK